GVEVVHTDVARIDKAIAGRAHPGVVEFDCLTLGQDVNKDYSTTLPTPDVAFSTDLGNAYEVFLQYSSDCVNHKGSPASVAVDAHYITTGNQDLAAAQARSEVILK
ncbi:MAG: hypothetical protein ACRDX8_09210, partial [Acidimicrobiales bacterium]